MRLTHREKLLLALANARESLGREVATKRPALSKLNTLRGVNDAEDTREGNLLSRTGVKTRPTFDIIANQVLGETSEWTSSVDIDEGDSSFSQIAAKRIGEMRENFEIDEVDEETLGDSFGLLKDGRPVWAEVLDNQRGYTTKYSDFEIKDLHFEPDWPPVQKISDHKTWKNWHVVDENSRASAACEKVIARPGITMNPLLILGDSGCGKSHILSASVQAMIRRQDGNVHLLSTSAMRGWKALPNGWQDAVAHASLIAIDDLHHADAEIATEIGLMIDYALNHGVQIIATSRVDSNEWPARRLWEVMRSATSIWINKPSSSSLITHLRRNTSGRALLLNDSMLARIVKHGDGDWRSTDAAFEKVALAIESGERILDSNDVSAILNEKQIVKDEYQIYEERDSLEDIATNVVRETLDTVYTDLDPTGVELNVPIPDLSDDWEIPELTIQQKDELHEVLTSENLTPHVTTTLTVDESEKFLVNTEIELPALDKVRVSETTSSIDSITDKMFEDIAKEHADQSNKLAELESEMIALAEKSKAASVDELIQIADRIGEIEMALGNISEAPAYAKLTPVKLMKPVGEEA